MTKAVTIITSCGNDAVSPLERGDGATTVLPPPTTSTSAGAAITRSLLLFMGVYRPSEQVLNTQVSCSGDRASSSALIDVGYYTDSHRVPSSDIR
jgi:hypothetical protein